MKKLGAVCTYVKGTYANEREGYDYMQCGCKPRFVPLASSTRMPTNPHLGCPLVSVPGVWMCKWSKEKV